MEDYHILNQEEIGKERERSKTPYIVAIIILILILLGFGISIYSVRQRTTITGRAYEQATGNVELTNSYMFASPLTAKADGLERIRMTVFVLDSQGRGVTGKEVILGNQDFLKIESIQGKTDETGKAVFDITSNKVGLFIIEASIDNKALPQKVSIIFN
ncbi:hypothetical protein A2W13_00035 [Candidatus Woesebacteria bacterium RBG_16_36_11]|uniref:Big-1 domain-containing protein n=1 Tax=Candidatus Woesebacteria bacterium RBG_16_36_11 TaxID=1802481 RepID=A0A1F7XAK1_9BACT|nr:MAG: hypothetical protein A2W13_00035 [Candidatus Woesebacteria bacterium RBG_16_36_11]